jgi:uncharacterized protein (TIGR00730 family)
MKRICVFCGSSAGARPEYIQAARQLGRLMAGRHLSLIYGGSTMGMMGELADATLEAGGEVIGVMYRKWAEKETHPKLSDLRIADTLHERKSMMAELSDAFIALPGGIGTLDEVFSMLALAQTGMHRKPCGLLNVCRYYDKLIEFLDDAVSEQFIRGHYRAMIHIDESPEGLLGKLKEHTVRA